MKMSTEINCSNDITVSGNLQNTCYPIANQSFDIAAAFRARTSGWWDCVFCSAVNGRTRKRSRSTRLTRDQFTSTLTWSLLARQSQKKTNKRSLAVLCNTFWWDFGGMTIQDPKIRPIPQDLVDSIHFQYQKQKLWIIFKIRLQINKRRHYLIHEL